MPGVASAFARIRWSRNNGEPIVIFRQAGLIDLSRRLAA